MVAPQKDGPRARLFFIIELHWRECSSSLKNRILLGTFLNIDHWSKTIDGGTRNEKDYSSN